MLVEFRVKNFRSIRTEQRLSLVADKDNSLTESHLQESESRVVPKLLKSAVIYGPNASGKSNLINALAYMQRVVATSATEMREGQQFDCPTFKLDAKSKKEPSEFELTFVDQGIRYQYGFSLLPERVVEEWLLVYKASKPQMWFTRKYDTENMKEYYEFGSHLTGQRAQWQELTRANALFLSKAVDLNSERLRPIYLWIVENLIIFTAGLQPIFDFSIQRAQTEEGKVELLRFLSAADLSIADLTLENEKRKQVGVYFKEGKISEQMVKEVEAPIPLFVHTAEEGTASFRLGEESTGTQRLFAFAGPILDVLKNGRVLVVDELDNSLHTLMLRFLLGQFHSTDNNQKGAQLIFSTHDTSLLDHKIFRRDQIWLVKKDSAQATILYPLTDFSPRKKEALDRGYIDGRYGAVPFFEDYKL